MVSKLLLLSDSITPTLQPFISKTRALVPLSETYFYAQGHHMMPERWSEFEKLLGLYWKYCPVNILNYGWEQLYSSGLWPTLYTHSDSITCVVRQRLPILECWLNISFFNLLRILVLPPPSQEIRMVKPKRLSFSSLGKNKKHIIPWKMFHSDHYLELYLHDT